MNIYDEIKSLNQRFKIDLFKHCGVDDNQYYNKIYSKVREDNHNFGFFDIALAFEDLLKFLDSLEELTK